MYKKQDLEEGISQILEMQKSIQTEPFMSVYSAFIEGQAMKKYTRVVPIQ